MKNKIYFENLDGLRAIAALAVVFNHIAKWIPSENTVNSKIRLCISFFYQGGELGVIFFFILSGFLITYLLINEQEKNGKIAPGNFYMRRVLRIWPLYYLTLIIGFVIYPLLHPEINVNASELYYVLFLANFDHIINGGPGLGILGVQWSVAVEEQFYLFWPLIFLLKNNKLKFIIIALAVILSEIFYISNANDWSVVYFHFFSCIRYLGIGAIFAFVSFYKRLWIDSFFSHFSKIGTIAVYLISLFILFITPYLNEIGVYKNISHLLPLFFFCFVILEQNYNGNSFFKMNRFKLMNYLGKISYGIYLTHMIAIYIVLDYFPINSNQLFIVKALLVIILTVTMSHLSYQYFERPFLNFKEKYNSLKSNQNRMN